MRVTWLPEVLRSAGLVVKTYPGWETRGSSSWGPLRGIICHATAGSRTSTDAGEMSVLWETGSSTAPTPIAQMYLSRSGAFTVGASGLCYHALIGQKGPHQGYGNSSLLGIEAANDNRGEPWPAAQVDAYQRGVAAICRHMGWTADVAVAHREHQFDKSDPLGIDMTVFRRRVAELIAGQEEDDVKFTIRESNGSIWLCDFMSRRAIRTEAEWKRILVWGASGKLGQISHLGDLPATESIDWYGTRIDDAETIVLSPEQVETLLTEFREELAKQPKPLTKAETVAAAKEGANLAEDS